MPVRDNLSQNTKIGTKTSQQNFAPGLDEIWKNLQENERLRQKRFYAVNLLKELSKNRELAMQRRDGHKVMVEIIEDNIDEIKRKTGLTQVLNFFIIFIAFVSTLVYIFWSLDRTSV